MTTFQQAGVLPTLIVFDHPAELQQFAAQEKGFFVLGKGSNTLVNTDALPPTFIQISSQFSAPEVTACRLKVNAGTPVAKLMSVCQTHGLSGLEFAAGVPASVGGMVFMNFGCWGKDLSQVLEQVEIVDEKGEMRWLPVAELAMAYRSSIFHTRPWVITHAVFNLTQDDPQVIKTRVKDAIRQRIDKQPLNEKTFGSIFKNPPQTHAAKLLEELGYKGYAKNAVKISEKHSNFLVNTGNASFQDIDHFLRDIRATVKAKTGIELELEVRMVP